MPGHAHPNLASFKSIVSRMAIPMYAAIYLVGFSEIFTDRYHRHRRKRKLSVDGINPDQTAQNVQSDLGFIPSTCFLQACKITYLSLTSHYNFTFQTVERNGLYTFYSDTLVTRILFPFPKCFQTLIHRGECVVRGLSDLLMVKIVTIDPVFSLFATLLSKYLLSMCQIITIVENVTKFLFY